MFDRQRFAIFAMFLEPFPKAIWYFKMLFFISNIIPTNFFRFTSIQMLVKKLELWKNYFLEKKIVLGKHFATYRHICTSFMIFSMQLEEKKCIFFLEYSVILGIFWHTLSSKHMWGSVQVTWMLLACATYRYFIYHPTWASCS